MRTNSDPASASATIWRDVATASSVSVSVIDCTTIGVLPPTMTPPTFTPADRRLFTAIRLFPFLEDFVLFFFEKKRHVRVFYSPIKIHPLSGYFNQGGHFGNQRR
jgi:hypothetical protein